MTLQTQILSAVTSNFLKQMIVLKSFNSVFLCTYTCFLEMKSQLMSAELKNKRLMEAFKKTSQEIREVCYQLTGYRIDIPTSNQYRLTSMYAESPNDHLLFQVSIVMSVTILGPICSG